MTTPTSLTAAETTGPAQSGSSKTRSFKRIGAAGLALGLVLGAGVAVGTHVRAQTEQSDTMTPPSLYVAIKGERAFDSRVDFPNQKIDDVFTVAVNRNKLIVPNNAVAIAYTVTVTATEGSGYAFIDPYDGTDGSEISNVAWTEPGQRVVNSGVTKTFDGSIDGGTMDVQLIQIGVGGTDAAAHVIIDVTGYLLPAD